MTAVPPPAGSPDAGVAWHYGDPFGEQRALAAGRGVVDLANRAVVAVTGPDRLGWLHDLTTQHLTGLQPGDSALALVLSPQGHVEHELHLADDGDTAWIVTEASRAPDLLAFLERMRFLLRVEIADRSADLAIVWLPGAEQPEGAVAGWRVPEPFAGRGFAGTEWILDRPRAAAFVAASDSPAGSWALEALRVAALMPRIGLDTDHRTIPNEVGWLGTPHAPNAVHLDKGCYRGQETVAKVNNLGRPPRRLALLHLDGTSEQPPAHGAEVWSDGARVGWIGTGVQHYLEGTIATAMLKRSVPADARLEVRDADGRACAAAEAPGS